MAAIRRGARLLHRLRCSVVRRRSPALGAKLLLLRLSYGADVVEWPRFAAGRGSYTDCGVRWFGVGAPPRGEAFALAAFPYGADVVEWPPFAAGRGSYTDCGVRWFGVGAPPRGEAFAFSAFLRFATFEAWAGCRGMAALRRGARLLHRLRCSMAWRRGPAPGRSLCFHWPCNSPSRLVVSPLSVSFAPLLHEGARGRCVARFVVISGSFLGG